MPEVTAFSLMNGNKLANDHKIPNHVAIIMDGNGRWAESRGLPRLEGHRAGTQNVRRLVQALEEWGVKYVTLFAFSTENWSRPSEEVRGLMHLLQEVLDREIHILHKNNAHLNYLGRMDRLSPEFKTAICNALELTRNNTGLNLSIALDYGGRDEIIEAIRQIVSDRIPAEKIDGELLQKHLYTRDLPDPDLIIRTAGEQRLSNFLVWQSAYSEYYCSSAYWPDFDEKELANAIGAFSQRQRRFGTLTTKE